MEPEMLEVELPDEFWPCEFCRDPFVIGSKRRWCSGCGANVCVKCLEVARHICPEAAR